MMMRSYSILALIFILTLTAASITKTRVVETYDTCIKLIDSTRDASGNIHLLYTRKPESSLQYLSLSPAGDHLLASTLYEEKVDMASIKVVESNIYVAFSVERQIWFTESADEGKTWEKPRIFHEKEYKYGREAPQILYVKEKERLFIFYIRGESRYMDHDHIAYVSRPKDSTVFSQESSINTLEYIDSFALVYTPHFWSPHLHVFVSIYGNDGENRTLWQVTSSNNGVSWHTPKALAEGVEYVIAPMVAMDLDTPENIFVTYAKHYPHLLAMKYSKNKGDKWSKEYISGTQIKMLKRNLRQNNLQIVKTGKTHRLISFFEGGNLDKYFYSHWDFPGMNEKVQTHPFNGIISRGSLMTAINIGDTAHVAVFVTNEAEGCTGGSLVMGIDTFNN